MNADCKGTLRAKQRRLGVHQQHKLQSTAQEEAGLLQETVRDVCEIGTLIGMRRGLDVLNDPNADPEEVRKWTQLMADRRYGRPTQTHDVYLELQTLTDDELIARAQSYAGGASTAGTDPGGAED